MVKELYAAGLRGQELEDEVARLTGLPPPERRLLIGIELGTTRGDTIPPVGSESIFGFAEQIERRERGARRPTEEQPPLR